LSTVSELHSPIAGASSLRLNLPQKKAGGVLPFQMIENVVLCCDLTLIVIASVVTGIAYHLAFFGRIGSVETFLSIGAIVCVNFSAILAARGAYRPQNLTDFWKQVRVTLGVWTFVFLLLSAVAFSFKVGEIYSRGATLTLFVAGGGTIVIWRWIIARFIERALTAGAFAEQKVVLIAEKAELADTSRVEEIKSCGYKPVKTFEFTSKLLADDSSWLMNSVSEIVKISRQEKLDCIFLLMSWSDRTSVEQLTKALRVLSIPIYLLPDANVAHFLDRRVVTIGTSWTAELKRAPLGFAERMCKRAIDLVVASVALVMLAPIMLLVAAAIKLDSRGPILFAQTRDGFNGRSFKMWKFRTMSVAEDGPVIQQATKNDPRVTRFGRILRPSSIDELPQLLNVILGDMALVGPRPHASAHNLEYGKIISNYAYRHHVKPGLTGWAQVHGLRGETRTTDLMEKRVEFDLWYINNWSLWLDWKILLRTLLVGLQPTAY
jgi:undecaprenyl-phosphate galactose phosphotransferase/putative colanic acid biosynthesis UDP-glucose lipid carrier transferase